MENKLDCMIEIHKLYYMICDGFICEKCGKPIKYDNPCNCITKRVDKFLMPMKKRITKEIFNSANQGVK